MEWFGKCLGVEKLDDWYRHVQKYVDHYDYFHFKDRITYEDLRNCGGQTILEKYDHSLLKILKEMYPDHDWQPWRFGAVSRGYWEDENNQHRYMEWICNELKIEHPNNWRRITRRQIASKRGRTLLLRHGNSLTRTLNAIYPEYDWEIWKFDCVHKV
jgi:hypothetical protein